jgi:hypothetical protein
VCSALFRFCQFIHILFFLFLLVFFLFWWYLVRGRRLNLSRNIGNDFAKVNFNSLSRNKFRVKKRSLKRKRKRRCKEEIKRESSTIPACPGPTEQWHLSWIFWRGVQRSNCSAFSTPAKIKEKEEAKCSNIKNLQTLKFKKAGCSNNTCVYLSFFSELWRCWFVGRCWGSLGLGSWWLNGKLLIDHRRHKCKEHYWC